MRPHLRGITPSILLEQARRGPLQGCVLLDGVGVTELAALLAGARWVRLSRGDRLTLGGSRPGECCLLLTGFVKEHRALEDGSEAVQAFRGPGDLVAEVSALTGCVCDHDTTAMGNSEALALPAGHLHAVMRDSPGLQRALLRAVASRATSAEATLARNMVGDTSARVAMAIVELANRWGIIAVGGVHLATPLSQSELAEWVGASRETVAKALHRLRAGGLVATSRRSLVVHDMRGLRRAAGLGDRELLGMPA